VSHVHKHASPKRTNYAQMSGPGDWWTPPDDDGLTPCPVCDGDGYRMVLSDDSKPCREVCPACEGARWLDESGYPYTQQESE
jgi:hypothetical protein